jgi:hypothetical protein
MNPQGTIKQHPHASVGATGTLAVVVVWLAGNVLHWTISAEDGAVLATVVSAVALYLAHNGIVGIARIFIWGTRHAQPQGTQP